MAFATRCPHCGTAFRVGRDLVGPRGGLVRCGVCSEVFDGAASLVELPEEAGRAAPTPEPLAGAAIDAAQDFPAVLRNRENLHPGVAADDEAVPASPVPVPSEAVAGDGEAWRVRAFSARGDVGQPGPVSAPARSRSAFLDEEAEALRRRQAAWWGAAAFVAVLALLVQAAWIFRAELSQRVPAARPVLEAACRIAGCSVPYPRDVARLSIESSRLEPLATDPAADASSRRLLLTIVLRNRAPFAQAWPAFDLSFTDLSDTVVARKAVLPADYLPQESAAAPLAPGEERELRIPVDVAGVAASGYRLDLFYP